MCFIRKPLSRKFNIVCLNLAGLLTCSMLFGLPIRLNSGIEVNNTLLRGAKIGLA
ncbi:hypothetical protein CLV81_2823 [Flagellimonas meridianipacifica]|uniref:Uncharacterized protein n=1 Tax=Flagellimonas meridianipacifica TaxID=1080225 RepID=A0A2T0MAJ0_9FLAO|nr:hypothetical protein CLV81_2823 [Allomuricauda pacifica]